MAFAAVGPSAVPGGRRQSSLLLPAKDFLANTSTDNLEFCADGLVQVIDSSGKPPLLAQTQPSPKSVADIALLQNPQFEAALDEVVILGVQKSSEEWGYEVSYDKYLSSEEWARFTDKPLQELRDGSLDDSLSSVKVQQQNPEVLAWLRAILNGYTEILHTSGAAVVSGRAGQGPQVRAG